MSPRHVPVMLDRVVSEFAPVMERVDHPVVIDATLGLGGHTEALLTRYENLHVIGVDRDTEALRRAGERLAPFGDRFEAAHAVYDELPEVVEAAGRTSVDGVLFDLGVSSMQLDVAERGFAYAQDAPLDMRMNSEDDLTAADVLNTYAEADLARILREYGEEKFARRIAKEIVRERETRPFERSDQLVDLIRRCIPIPARRTGGNPAKRTFQALRIEVNDELGVYRRALPAALDLLAVGGRVVVLSYHSLEDRITKRVITSVTTTTAPRDLPVVPESMQARFRSLTRGAELAGEDEIADNPRARSVRMRAVERIAES
ncbi:ribosomal RNA small subunit methyltransferase H [Aeromicrobium flavum]|uniref:Ribosomal RNA small subunit methyltransferase H n=1 Tax=Aeromicrobium flavum TaxID=416568 RepID=A0A512HQP3_9ACTN|nr:16S rRNA (cytosine(1402)-N(4))-methyltransferase RsmH [Aeromicrobium flavum]GEO87773.1 ribosomal RNA small subunit methyltransferase H [Aeromicrobium flavum]